MRAISFFFFTVCFYMHIKYKVAKAFALYDFLEFLAIYFNV